MNFFSTQLQTVILLFQSIIIIVIKTVKNSFIEFQIKISSKKNSLSSLFCQWNQNQIKQTGIGSIVCVYLQKTIEKLITRQNTDNLHVVLLSWLSSSLSSIFMYRCVCVCVSAVHNIIIIMIIDFYYYFKPTTRYPSSIRFIYEWMMNHIYDHHEWMNECPKLYIYWQFDSFICHIFKEKRVRLEKRAYHC